MTVAEILRKYAGRQLPLMRTGEQASEALASINGLSAEQLFPSTRAPMEAHAGLLLWLGDWARAHDIADRESQDAYYWHAIIHRIEPDIGNSGYWFRKVGAHPIFAELRERASRILSNAGQDKRWLVPATWDPFLFNRWCEEARREHGSPGEAAARQIQQAEWELLFSWCTEPVCL